MFHCKIIILTAILACFSDQFVPVESTGSVLDRLRSFSQSVCDFFHPGRSSTTQAPTINLVNENVDEDNSATENYDIDVRLNEDGQVVPETETAGRGNTRKIIGVTANCPPGQRLNRAGQCRPIYK